MPQGLVVSRNPDATVLKVAFDAAVSHYNIYSSELGPDVDFSMKLVKENIAAPANIGGFSTFATFTDNDLKILNPTRPWWVRITKKIGGSSNRESSVISTPGTQIPADGSTPDLLYLDNTGNFSLPA